MELNAKNKGVFFFLGGGGGGEDRHLLRRDHPKYDKATKEIMKSFYLQNYVV